MKIITNIAIPIINELAGFTHQGSPRRTWSPLVCPRLYNLKYDEYKDKGQALVTLLIFVATAMVVILGAIGVVMVTSFGTGKLALGEEDYHLAEAGVENAILRLLRDHNYTGETLNIGNGSVIITISGGGNKTILGEAVLDNNFRRKIKIEGNLASNSFSLTRWVEVP